MLLSSEDLLSVITLELFSCFPNDNTSNSWINLPLSTVVTFVDVDSMPHLSTVNVALVMGEVTDAICSAQSEKKIYIYTYILFYIIYKNWIFRTKSVLMFIENI